MNGAAGGPTRVYAITTAGRPTRIYATHAITALDVDIRAAQDRAWRRATGAPDNSSQSPAVAPAPTGTSTAPRAPQGSPRGVKRPVPAERAGEIQVWLTEQEVAYLDGLLAPYGRTHT